MAFARQRGGEVDRCRGFADAAFLVGDRQNHYCFQHRVLGTWSGRTRAREARPGDLLVRQGDASRGRDVTRISLADSCASISTSALFFVVIK